jgi:hypothetical protein
LHEPCRAALLASGSATRSLFYTEVVKRLLDEHRMGTADRTEELYTLWIFEEWHRQFIRPGSQTTLTQATA